MWRDAINECSRWPLHATRTTMGDTVRALHPDAASFRSVCGRLPWTQPLCPPRSLRATVACCYTRSDSCDADRREKHIVQSMFTEHAKRLSFGLFFLVAVYFIVHLYNKQIQTLIKREKKTRKIVKNLQNLMKKRYNFYPKNFFLLYKAFNLITFILSWLLF